MRLTLRQLQIFVAVAETGSTAAAGAAVALSQSATSGALNELEALLEAKVFDRVGRGLVLNDTGRALLPRARAMLDGAREIERAFGIDPGGRADCAGAGTALVTRLRIGASTTIGNHLLPALAASFLRDHPGAAVDATIGNTREIAAATARLDVDLGLIEGPCPEPGLVVEPWLEDELVIVCALHHPVRAGGPDARVGVKVLRAQRWLVREPGSGTREAVEQALLPHLHHWADPMQLGSSEAIQQAAAAGLGLACLSSFAVRDLVALGRLVVVRHTLPRLVRRFYVVRHRDKQCSAHLLRFVAHCEAARREDFFSAPME